MMVILDLSTHIHISSFTLLSASQDQEESGLWEIRKTLDTVKLVQYLVTFKNLAHILGYLCQFFFFLKNKENKQEGKTGNLVIQLKMTLMVRYRKGANKF